MKLSRILRWPILLLTLVLLLTGTSGCACGSIQASSWSGLPLADGKIYIADLQQIQILGADGKVIGAVPKNTENNSLGLLQVTPAVGDGYLIVATQTRSGGIFPQQSNPVIKLDIETGEELWRFEQAKGQFFEGGVISDGIFVIGNSDNNVYALNVETGEPAWEKPFKTGHRVWATPLIVDGTVYIGSMDGYLYALRLSDGEKIWQFPSESTPGVGAFASTPALKDGVLYIGTFANRLYAINADDGTQIWCFPAEKPGADWFWGSPAVYGDTVYAIDVKGRIYALGAQTGETVWNKELDAPIRGGPALTEDGRILLISSKNGTLYALDATDGSKKWEVAGEGQGYVTPVVDGNIVYEAKIHGAYRVRALELQDNGDDYRELWVYPLPEENTGE